MHLYTKDVKKIGFEGSGLFDDSKWYHFYYAKVPKTRRIYIIDSLEPSVSHFELTKKEWREFMNNKLSLVPKGCCCATGNKHKEHPIIDFKGDWETVFGNKKRALEFIEKLVKEKK